MGLCNAIPSTRSRWGIETNGGMAYNIKNELRVWNGGTDAALFGPIKINAVKTAIGPGDGGDTSGERLEVEADGVWLGSSSSNSSTINAFKVFGAGVGFTPVIAARGAESTRGMGFDIPGTGKFGYTSGTYARTNFEIYANGTSNSWVSVDGGTNISYVDARSTNANADLQLAPKGTGKLLLKGIPYVLLRRTTALSLAPNVGTTVSWDAEDVDTHGIHAAGSSSLVAPVSGLYHFESGFNVEGLSSSNNLVVTAVYLIVNGVAVRSSPFIRHRVTNGVASAVGSAMSMDYYLFAGDTAQIQFYYGTDSGVSAGISTTFNYNYLNMRLVVA